MPGSHNAVQLYLKEETLHNTTNAGKSSEDFGLVDYAHATTARVERVFGGESQEDVLTITNRGTLLDVSES